MPCSEKDEFCYIIFYHQIEEKLPMRIVFSYYPQEFVKVWFTKRTCTKSYFSFKNYINDEHFKAVCKSVLLLNG